MASVIPSWGFPGGARVKNPPVNAGDIKDLSSIPGSGRSPGGGHGNPLWYSCLENPRDGGAWWAAIYGVTQSRTRLKRLSSSSSSSGVPWRFQAAPVVRNPLASTGDMNSIPRSGRSPGGGHGNPLQYSCLENPKDRGAWQAGLQRADTTEVT